MKDTELKLLLIKANEYRIVAGNLLDQAEKEITRRLKKMNWKELEPLFREDSFEPLWTGDGYLYDSSYIQRGRGLKGLRHVYVTKDGLVGVKPK